LNAWQIASGVVETVEVVVVDSVVVEIVERVVVVTGTSHRVPVNCGGQTHVAFKSVASSQVPPFRQRSLQARIK